MPGSGAQETDLIAGDPSVELSSNRTSLSFERTRMSADRTLMSIVRTALALIGFGFTLYKAFEELSLKGVIADADAAARRLGVAMLLFGILILALGILSHARFDRELTRRRQRLFQLDLLRTEITYRATPTFVVAILLLLAGVGAFVSIAARLRAGL